MPRSSPNPPLFAAPRVIQPASERALDLRLHAMKAVDVILAALQTAFAQDHMMGQDNPYRFDRHDPKNSKVWICDPEGRTGFDRSGNRILITVSRADFSPQNLHLFNKAEGGIGHPQLFSELCTTSVYVQCEAGNKTQSETVASIVYQVVKMFRLEMMREFDIANIIPTLVSAPQPPGAEKGEPWTTTVSIRVETQESYRMSETENQLNRLDIVATYNQNTRTVSLDATPDVGG